MKLGRITLIGLSLAALTFVPLAGQRPASTDVTWPLPPEQPRIRYVGTLQTERDIGKRESFFKRFKNKVVGDAQEVLGVQRPHDIYVEDGKRFYVSDGARSKVVVFDSDTQSAWILGETGNGFLKKPMGLGGDGNGTVYVADASGDLVVAFDRDGNFVAAYGGEAYLHNPADVAVNVELDRLYVVDSFLHQVVMFSISTGEYLGTVGKSEGDLEAKRSALRGIWDGGSHGAMTPEEQAAIETEAVEAAEVEGNGQPGDPHDPEVSEPRDLVENRGSGPGEFRYPAFITIGPEGSVYVTDQMNFRVQVFDSNGNYLTEIGKLGDVPGTFARPKGVAVDSEGHIYVADGAFGNIQIFDARGRLLLVFAQQGMGEADLWLPLGIHIDSQDRLYAADRYHNRIQLYQYLPEVPGQQTAADNSAGSSN
jgi:DNA-binding beta-propeller fold protein YncE